MSAFPYPGLRPFKRDESDIFFGRQEHTDQLIDRLTEAHFIAVVGPSGCGKSSLVRTGLLATLDKENPGQWRIVEMRPGNHPFQELATKLLSEKALEFPSVPTPTQLQTRLRRGPLSFHEILDDHPLPDDTSLLLVIDQFEELFRPFKETNSKSPDSKNEAMAFVKLLLTGSQHPLVYVVITMRSDFIGDSAIFSGLPEAINQGIFVVPRLNRTQLQEVIEQPARKFNGEIEPILVNHLLNEMRNDPDQLPVLQHALMRMWNLAKKDGDSGKNTTLVSEKHYEQIGELDHALSKHANEIYESLSHPQQTIAKVLFRLLSDYKPDQRDTRRPVKLSEVAELASVTCEEVKTVVENFRQPGRNFLMPFPDKILDSDTTLEISHESFIRGWDKLKAWAKEEYDFAEEYRRLEERACRWNQGEEELLRGSTLARFIDWWNRAKPTPAWAKRYGGDFELTKRFLKDSEAQQRAKAKEQEKLKRTKKLLVGVTIGLLVAIGIARWFYLERNHAIALNTQLEQTVLKLFDSQITRATDSARREDYESAKQILKESRKLDSTVSKPRRHARDLLDWFSHLMGGSPQQVYNVGTGLLAVAVSPDGKLLAVAGEKGTLALFEVATGKRLRDLPGHTDTVKAVVFAHQGLWLVSAGEDKKIILWDLSKSETPRVVWSQKAPDKVTALAVSPDGKYLVSGGYDGNITLWKVDTGEKLSQQFKVTEESTSQKGVISHLAFDPKGERLASASYFDKTARLWEVKTGKVLQSLTGFSENMQNIIFSPNGEQVITSADDTIRLWKVNSGSPLNMTLKGHQGKVSSLNFITQDGQDYLVSASQDRTLRIWDTNSGVTLRVLQGHTAGINDITVTTPESKSSDLASQPTQQIFSVGEDGTVRRWDTVLPSQQIVTLQSNSQPRSTAIAPDGNSVAVGFEDGTLRLYSLPKGKLMLKTEAHEEDIVRLAFNSNGTLLASVSLYGVVKLWQTSKDGALHESTTLESNYTYNLYTIASAVQKNLFAVPKPDGQIELFTAGMAPELLTPFPKGTVTSIDFDASGLRLLTSGMIEGQGQLQLWELKQNSPQLLQTFSNAHDTIWATLSPDGQRVASREQDGVVYIYANGQKPFPVGKPEDAILRVIFSPDSQQLATVSMDATVRFWDLITNRSNLLFSLKLPMEANSWWRGDFDFRCSQQNCWIAVPLMGDKLVLYKLEQIYD